jgi:hypothetical protein
MSRKDYLAFAKIIADELQELREQGALRAHGDILLSLAWAMAEVFGADNPNFDEDRFMGACGFNYIPPPHEMSLAARWAA